MNPSRSLLSARILRILALIVLSIAPQTTALAHEPESSQVPPFLKGVDFKPILNSQIPLDLEFHDEQGNLAPLGEYVAGKPVLLALVYYNCSMLCSDMLEELASSIRGTSLRPGDDFAVVAVSFDPAETPALAASKKRELLERFPDRRSSAGWHFLTGDSSAVAALAQAVGFHFAYDPTTKQFIHAGGILVLTPEGKISRFFPEVAFASRDLQLGLVEASENKIGTLSDHLLLFCYQFDPALGKYTAAVMRLVRWGGTLTLFSLAALLFGLRRFRRRGNAIVLNSTLTGQRPC